MAKIKVRPQAGALSDLLKRKQLTQMDVARPPSSIDRKTLAKIDRGEEVKLETLQRLAKKLNVPDNFLEPSQPPAAESVENYEAHELSLPPLDERTWQRVGRVLLLGKLDFERLSQLIQAAGYVQWALNIKAADEKVRKLLGEFEEAVGVLLSDTFDDPDEETLSTLSFQLKRLKKGEDVAALMEQLAECGITILGADYLKWKRITENDHVEYRSSRFVLLSIERHSPQSRRIRVVCGREPPKFAPDVSKAVFVDGMQLYTEDGRKAQWDKAIPFTVLSRD
jgi:transcriptional regulator with XRE-family HTH domain